MDIQQIAEFMVAGDASFMLSHSKLCQDFIYRVQAHEDEERFWWVSCKVTIDGESEYAPLGRIARGRFYINKNSMFDTESDEVHLFELLFLKAKRRKNLPNTLSFTHLGRCGRCRRLLTTKASIDSGLGPKCREALNYN